MIKETELGQSGSSDEVSKPVKQPQTCNLVSSEINNGSVEESIVEVIDGPALSSG